MIWKILIFVQCIVHSVLSQDDDSNRGFVFATGEEHWDSWYDDYGSGDDYYNGYYKTSEIETYQGGPEIFKSKMKTKTANYKFQNPNTEARSLVVDAWNHSLYYLDLNTKSIYRLNNFTININQSIVTRDTIHQGISETKGTIVLDWISKNLYWTDELNDWIAMQSVVSNDTTMYRVILSVKSPVALAIDPEPGYLFFSDIKPSRIERSNLLGEERTVLAKTDLEFATSIVVDHRRQRIFWIDTNKGVVESISYEGLNRQEVYRGMLYGSTSMIFYKDYVCATMFMYQMGIACQGLTDNNTFIAHFDNSPEVMAVYDKDIQSNKGTNYCASAKCQHICVNTPTIARCVCKEGYELQKDNRTCTAGHILTKKGILYTNSTDVCVLNIQAINSDAHVPQCILSNLTYAHYLQADTSKGMVFMWNNKTKTLQKYDVTTKKLHNLTTTNTVKGVFYDWIDDGLYWSEQELGENYIRLFDLETGVLPSKYQYKGNSTYQYLTGNPFDYVLYWVLKSGNFKSKIEMGSMNGTNTSVIVDSKNVKNPTALTYDETYNRLFWLDYGSLMSISLNTKDNNYTDFHVFMSADSHTLSIYKDYALWIDDMNIKAVAFSRNEGKDTVFWREPTDMKIVTVVNRTEVISMTYYDQRTQRKQRAPCEGNNGGCQHICVPTSKGAECFCSFGYKLGKDKKTCGNEPLKDQFVLVMGYNGEVYQLPLNKNVTSDDVVAIPMKQISEYDYVRSFAYDVTRGFLYWSKDNTIHRSKLNGQNYTTVSTFVDGNPEALNIDESTGNVYFILRSNYYYMGTSHIAVGQLLRDGDFKVKKLIEVTEEATSLLIHPGRGYMFWITRGYRETLVRSNMDGTDQRVILNSMSNANFLSIDYSENRIYWMGYATDIRSADLNGGNIKSFRKGKWTDFIGFQDDFIFLSTNDGRKIMKMNKSTKKDVHWLSKLPYLPHIKSIILVPGNRQPVSKACQTHNGLCSTFCLPTWNGTTCACEENVNMRDKIACENVCAGTFPHGSVKDCSVRPDAVCDYVCDQLYSKNSSINKIKCFKNTTWDKPTDELCTEKRCSINVPNVNFTDRCEGKMNQYCNYKCIEGYMQTRYTSPMIYCLPRGGQLVWNTDVRSLCTRAVYCNRTIPNGYLFNCPSPTPGAECRVVCNEGYEPFISSGLVTCDQRRTGKWNEELDKICKPISTCSLALKDGKLENKCTGRYQEHCSYTCNTGKQRSLPLIDTVTCLKESRWSIPLDALCKDTKSSVTESLDTSNNGNNEALIGGLSGIIVLIIIVCIILAIVFFIKRRRALPEYKPEPNVFFRNPPVDENSYSQFSNTDVGHLAVTQFSNPMSGLDPLYDNISEKYMADNSGHPSKQDLKVVEEKTVDNCYSKENVTNKDIENESTNI